jgi:ribosomal RNA-processing protein 9
MAYMDTHYGHHSDILSMDYYSKDRVISSSLDRQCIFWKIDEDAELLYNNFNHTVDSVNVLNRKFFYTTSSDNAVDLWTMSKKKPIYSLEGLHAEGSWILSSANIRNSDIFCTGSYDGQVVVYGFNKEKKKFGVQGRIKDMQGCINNLKFSHHRTADLLSKSHSLMLAATHSKEEKMGRWHVQPKVKTGVSVLTKR